MGRGRDRTGVVVVRRGSPAWPDPSTERRRREEGSRPVQRAAVGRTSRRLHRLRQGVPEWVRGVGFSADGRRCAGFDSEDRLIVWDIRNGDKGARTLEYSDKLKSDKDFIVSAGVIGPDGTVLIGTREGELLHMYLKSAGE